jgi:hypothetical protein
LTLSRLLSLLKGFDEINVTTDGAVVWTLCGQQRITNGVHPSALECFIGAPIAEGPGSNAEVQVSTKATNVFCKAAATKATPFATHLQGTSELCSAFEGPFIAGLTAWEHDIATGRIDETSIRKSWSRVMSARADAEKKSLPRGLPINAKLKVLAKAETATCVNSVYPEGP